MHRLYNSVIYKWEDLIVLGIIYARDKKKMIPILLGGYGMKSGTVDALAIIVAGRILEDIIRNDIHSKS